MKKSCYIQRLIAIVMLFMVVMAVDAAGIDVVMARQIAVDFLRSQGNVMSPASTGLSLTHLERSSIKSDKADFYVFSSSEGHSFVIVSGDDRACRVLAYGSGSFDKTAMPCGLAALLGQYKEQVAYLHAHPGFRPSPRSEITSPPILPMLTCHWSQGTPYRDQCPVVDDKNCPTGCVATSMAQVMHYWRFPDALPALPAYVTSTMHINVPALQAVEMQWDEVLEEYHADSYSDAQGDAVATLMRYCGQSCKMDYTNISSNAWIGDQLTGMKCLKFDASCTHVRREDYSDEQWNALMLEDLSSGRPILYVGYGASGGHSYVIDGYDDGMYHVNWGYGGSSDGYYMLDAYNVSGTPYSDCQEMLHGVFPDPSAIVQTVYDFEQDGFYYVGNSTGLSVTCRSHEFNNYQGDIVIPAQVTVDGVTLPVTEIGDSAFADCISLTSVTLPPTITRIGNYAFTHCKYMKDLNFPESLITIGRGAFSDCYSFTRVELPPSVTRLGNYAFYHCVNLVDIMIGEGVRNIGQSAFQECFSIESLVLGCKVDTIGACAFKYCRNLQSVTIPATVQVLGEYCFDGCYSLESVRFADCAVVIRSGAFSDCMSLTNVDFGHYVKSMSMYSFGGCYSLREVKLPNSLYLIDRSAFLYCYELTHVVLGRGLRRIGKDAFTGCNDIQSITCKAVTPPDVTGSLPGSVTHDATLIVPLGTGDLYRAIEPWRSFKHIIEQDLDDDLGDVNLDGEVNIADVNAVIEAIITGNQTSFADVNQDGEVNIADINAVIDFILR